MRLYRRATSRFNNFDESNEPDVLNLWLMYAKAQTEYGFREEARGTYRFIQNLQLGVAQAIFYLQLSAFEQADPQAAIDALNLGIEKGAKPVEELKSALSKLTNKRIRTPGSKQVARSAKKRSKLLSKRPGRSALSGGARRLNPTERVENIDGDEDDQHIVDPQVDSIDQELAKPVPKLTKMDLSYMLNWEPTRKATNDGADEPLAAVVTRTTRAPVMERIDETTSGGSGSSTSAVTFNSGATTSRSINSNDSFASDRTATSVNDDNNPGKTPASAKTLSSTENSAMLSRCNSEFLPLVHENNILSVNKNPFVKLGVIGKGGSCKVYRALSKDCSVVAIKKVKLGHLDRKAIDGYANEIALLNRLRGNPAIIQMHDSEVDLHRQAIFLVMELGEVDLNHVLQQQSLQSADSSPGERPRLNMNFIRLTWYQMLQCVHCIHEERIIHGDLKPANFLFVRGALKLIDFGIAKAIQSDDTTNIYRDSQIGTLNYMSPEAILDTGSGKGSVRWKCGRVSWHGLTLL